MKESLVTTRDRAASPARTPRPARHKRSLPLIDLLEPRRLLSASLQPLPFPTSTSTTLQSAASFVPTYQVLTSSGLTPNQTAGPQGFTPAEIRAAYGINQISFNGLAGDGSGQTIAIIDAYNDPTIASDLHKFDLAFGIADPASFRVVAQDGSSNLPPVDPAGKGSNFEGEEALDVEWAHAIAPGANLILVEAKNASPTNLFAAVNWARQQTGVSVVSMSFGGNETTTETQYDSTFTTPAGHPGVTFIASTGDSGTPAGYPAYSPNVLATGGTSLSINSVGSYQSETGWSGSGGGISQVESQPAYQSGTVTQSATNRTAPDVAFDADPSTGVAVYDSYNNGNSTPWEIVGGTSLAAPAWAGLIAIANQGRIAAGEGTLDSRAQTLPLLYAAPAADFHDITTGNNGLAARSGYDLVTGRGSPVANLLIPFLVSGSTTTTNPPPPTGNPTIGSITASATTLTEGTPLTLTANDVSDPGASGLAVTFYEETNGTPGLQTGANGDYAFTPVTDGSNTITLDTTNATGTYTLYAQLTDAQGNASPDGTNAPAITVTVTAASTTGPSISSISASPAAIVSGDTLTLTANGVTDPTASVNRVYFYEESNGIPGLQTGFGGDFAFRPTTSASNYSIQLDTTGVTGSVTFYALAQDANGDVSATGSSAPTTSVDIGSVSLPDAPTNLTAAAVSTTEIDLAFNETDSGQTGFAIERSTDPYFFNATQLFTINGPGILTYNDTGLAPNTTYYYQVAAFNNAGDSAFSNIAAATTPVPATHLLFANQPVSTTAGQTLTAPVVYLLDAHNQIATADSSTVTLTLGKGPAGAALTTSVQAVNGVATFSNITLTAAGRYTLVAADSSLKKTATSKPFLIMPDVTSPKLALIQQPPAALVGVPLRPVLLVQLEDSFGNPLKSPGRMTIAVQSGPGTLNGQTTTGTPGGRGAFHNLWFTQAGNYTLQVADGSISTPLSLQVAQGATAIRPPHVHAAYVAGRPIPLLSQLTTNAPARILYTGTAEIKDQNGNVLATTAVTPRGVAKFTLTTLAAGTYTCTLDYLGDANHAAASSAPFTLQINAAPALLAPNNLQPLPG